MSSLVLPDRPSRSAVRVVALAAAVAVNAAMLLTLTLPSRPASLLMPALVVEVTAVLIEPPVALPPPPIPEPLPLPARSRPPEVRTVAEPAPVVVPAGVVESTISLPIAPPVATAVAEAIDAGGDGPASVASGGNGEMRTLAYASTANLRYPTASLRANEQGNVLLRVLVDAQGKPERIEVVRSSGYQRLDRAARESVQGWTFRPVLQNGIATSAWGLVPVSFHLDRG